MARLVTQRCPNCGASLQVAPGVSQVVCPYCQVTSELRASLPPPPAPPGAGAPARSSGWAVAAAVVVAVIGIAASLIARLLPSEVKQRAARLRDDALGRSAAPRTSFADFPFLYDVNADGTADVLGMIRLLQAGSPYHLAALDGRDGRELWRSDVLTAEAAESMSLRSLIADSFVVVDELGTVQAYSAKTGRLQWTRALGARAQRLCQGEGFVRIMAASGRAQDLTLATGQPLAAPPTVPCRSLGASGLAADGYQWVSCGDYRNRRSGSAPGASLFRDCRALVPDEGERALLLGDRASGDGVALVAAVQGDALLWQTVVPAVEPLSTRVHLAPPMAAMDGRRVVVPYPLLRNKGVRLAAFDARTGARLWDVAVHDGSPLQFGMVLTERDVYYSTADTVYVFSVERGELRLKLGLESGAPRVGAAPGRLP